MKKSRLITFMVCLIVSIANFAQDRGDATYYSNRLHGRRTSDGSVYHKDSLTCAHKNYPLGTILKVRNQKNGREVIVKVTDRGPYRRGAIVDLSWKAAEELGMLSLGVIKVEVEKVDAENVKSPFRDNRKTTMPQIKLEDNKTGDYYTLPQWNERMKSKEASKAIVKAKTTSHSLSPRRMAHNSKKDSVPRWRIIPGRLSASSGNQNQDEHNSSLQ